MQVKEVTMSESESIRKRHVALANEIINNAYCIAGAIVAENGEYVDGEYIPLEHKILRDLAKKVSQKIS